MAARDVEVTALNYDLALALFADGTTGEIIMWFDGHGDCTTNRMADPKSLVVKDPIRGYHAVDCSKYDPVRTQ